ncbi:MAG: fasciclin domain-containing protein [Bacteroidota bacterium]
MKNLLRWHSYVLLAMTTLLTFSCSDDDEGNALDNEAATAMSIVETAQNTDALSSLVAALAKADENENSDLIGTLSADGSFTVFAPTNTAFTNLLAELDGFDSLDDFDTEEERELLGWILQYHVVSGIAAASTDLSEGQVIETVQGESVTISLEDGVFIDDATDVDAEVIIPDVPASNGIIHVIDKILLPQAVINALNPPQDLVDLVIATDMLSSLEAAVIKAGLVETLQGDGPFTVFAPTDDAFAGLLMALGSDYTSLDDFDTEEEIALLRDILLYHVLPIQVLEADLTEGEVPTALENNAIAIIPQNDTFVIGDASDTNAGILAPDNVVTNGVAHIIDKVLLPQSAIDFLATLELQNIVEIAVATDDLSLLVEALTTANAGLVEALSGEGPFTVFAPTNAAFVALLDVLGDEYNSLEDFDTQEELDLLVSILTYHVVPEVEAFSTDLTDGQQVTTLNGATLTIGVNSNGVSVQDVTDDAAHVDIPDVDASNGVVHVIDKVLLPQEAVDFVTQLNMKNIVELAIATDDLSLLVDALIQANAGLVEALSGAGPFTVFAPDNHAFEELLDVLGDDYHSLADFDTQEELDLLVSILTYHVVPEVEAFSTDLTDGQQVTTLNGATLTIGVNSNGVSVQDVTDDAAHVDIPDVDASNGVVHVIDKVLLPQEAIDFVTQLNMKNIVEFAIATDDLSLLVDALIAANAGLVEALSGDGPFTVFAPDNHAFAELLEVLGDDYDSLADFDTQEELDLLVSILTYHVVSGVEAFSTDLSNGQQVTTLNGASLTIGVNGNGISVRDVTDDPAHVDIPDVDASNGVVHIIDKVLLPQEAIDFVAKLNMQNIVELAIATNDLSVLVEALIQANAGLVEALGSPGPFTVFAPDNHAFEDLFDLLGDGFHSISDFDTDAELAILIDVLTYHVVSGVAAFSTDLSNGQMIPTLQGESVTISLNGGVQIKDATDSNAQVVGADNAASNGVVHIIDKVLLPQSTLDALTPPQPNIVELAQSIGDLSILVEALIQADAGLVDVLSSDGPFTVFAPDNHAFEELFQLLGSDFHDISDFDTPEEKELLATVLTYHVVAGQAFFKDDLGAIHEVTTVQGETIGINIRNNGVINLEDKSGDHTQVTTEDAAASNGVVHIVNQVLLPQEFLDALNTH